MPNPCGLHIQAAGQRFNRIACLQHVKAADYVTCTVLDDLQLAIDLNIPYAVFRAYTFEPMPADSSDGAAREAAREAMKQIRGWVQTHGNNRNVLFMVNCEQGWTIERNMMYTYMIEDSASDPGGPIGLCVGNYASGAIKAGQGGEPNHWRDQAEPLLRALAKHKNTRLPNGSHAFVLGDHYYTGIFPWIAVNGGEKNRQPRWEDRPTTIDWNKPQWHLGRGAQGIMKACAEWGIEPPPMIITECLIDDMNDVAYTFGNRDIGDTGLKLAAGYNKARGWRSLIPQWQEWYPGHDPGEVLADMTIWAWETIYGPLGFVIGSHTYTYSDASGQTNQWVSFTVDDSPEYLRKMEAYRYTASEKREIGLVYPALPVASDPRWERVLASPFAPMGVQPLGFTNIRRIPTTDGNAPVMQLSGEKVPARIIREITFADKWTVIDLQGVIGWIHRDYVIFTPFEENPAITSTQELVAPVVATTDTPVTTSDTISRAEFETAIQNLKAEFERIASDMRRELLDELIAALERLRDGG